MGFVRSILPSKARVFERREICCWAYSTPKTSCTASIRAMEQPCWPPEPSRIGRVPHYGCTQHVGHSLTRRCSGLATLAAELHFVRLLRAIELRPSFFTSRSTSRAR